MPTEDLPTRVRDALNLARERAFKEAHEDGHWCGEAMDNATFTSQYISLLSALNLEVPNPESWIKKFLAQQHADGGWPIAPVSGGELSTSVEAYFTLKLLGLPSEHEAMRRGRNFILSKGGIENVRIFTRINLAIFGLFPWTSVPELPPEIIFIPDWFPLNVYHVASWARLIVIPMTVVRHHRPSFCPDVMKKTGPAFLDELWHNPHCKDVSYAPSGWDLITSNIVTSLSTITDYALHALDGLRCSPINRIVRRNCIEWTLDRQGPDGDIGGIYPACHFGVLALFLEGYAVDSQEVRGILDALRSWIWTGKQGTRIQSTISPMWDTSLMAIGMLDAAVSPPRLQRAIDWMKERQHTEPKGDWRVRRQHVTVGGFAFQNSNPLYPDIDDTCAVICALVQQDPSCVNQPFITSAVVWVIGMQCSDGGWAGFDWDNDKLFLDNIPFSDTDGMCDPSTPDVTGDALEALGLVLQAIEKSAMNAISYLEQEQESFGGWFGRWGVNYIYGTCNVVCGLAYFQTNATNAGCSANGAVHVLMDKAIDWVSSVQNEDGGWGECVESYNEVRLAGTGLASNATQTAWALMTLLTRLPPSNLVIMRGVQFLLERRSIDGEDAGTWVEEPYVGTGFPRHLYMNYAHYKHYFPMMALGRYARLAGASQSCH